MMFSSVKFSLVMFVFAFVMIFLTGCQTLPPQGYTTRVIQEADRILQDCASCKRTTGSTCYVLGKKCPEY
jgi:hypothetical protein